MSFRVRPNTVPADGWQGGQRYTGYLPPGIYEEYRKIGGGRAIVTPIGGVPVDYGWAAYFVDADYLPGDDPQVNLSLEIREARKKLDALADHLGALLAATHGVDDAWQRMGVVLAQAVLMRRALVDARQSLNACWSVVNQEVQ